jgi:hypothetical protein
MERQKCIGACRESESKQAGANRGNASRDHYGRGAILKVASTVAAQIPGYGTVAALALDGANALLNVAGGSPKRLEKEATRSQKRSTQAFMRAMREQAAKERFSGNTEANELRNGKSNSPAR